MGAIKELLKKILPPPVRTFLREIEGLQRLTERQAHLLAEGQDRTIKAVERQAEELARLLGEQTERAEKLRRVGDALTEQVKNLHRANEGLADRLERLEKSQRETLEKLESLRVEVAKGQKTAAVGRETLHAQMQQAEVQRKALSTAVEQARKQSVDAARFASEAVWAETFNNTINGSAWLKNTAFSPGRWAVGYPVLYVMYRVLNEARPQRILELGLGQSTRMIGQYVATHEGVEHVVVEHDPEWIAFFKNDFALSERTEILQLDREMVPYKEAEAVRVFQGFREALAGKKFDFIFIDAPLGGDMKQYARIDVLRLLPECLSENFVIMIDDAERGGETHTVAEMEKRLREHGILCRRGRYSGKKDCVVLTPEHMGFLTTM